MFIREIDKAIDEGGLNAIDIMIVMAKLGFFLAKMYPSLKSEDVEHVFNTLKSEVAYRDPAKLKGDDYG